MTTQNDLVHHESAVRSRYSDAARATEPALCCPVNYDARYLEAIPAEIIERDYGCGDPSRWVERGDRVLDLGSGGGKICYIAAQVVGAEGSVVGVDMNDDMLALARRHRAAMAEKLGYDNVTFHKGRIQDLALDLERVHDHLRRHPVTDLDGFLQLERTLAELRREEPMIADASIDVVVSNCVLNLVDEAHRHQLYREIARVLAPGGRAVISDIVSDADVPESMRRDPELWSGCISGTMREDRFLKAFTNVGLAGVEILERQAEPWTVVEGIEFRSLTVRAHKLPHGQSLDVKQSVGEGASATDDRRTRDTGCC